MKKLLLSLTLCVAFIASMSAQQMQIVQNKADSLRDSGDLKMAIAEFEKLYLQDSTNRNICYNYACALALNKQEDEALHYLKIATANDSSVQALNDPDFYYLIDNEEWSEIEDGLVERVEAKFGEYEDIELSKELWRMKVKDQAFYYHIDLADKAVGPQSPIIGALWELKTKINNQNLTRIQEIIDTKGWPKSSVVKGSAASTVFLIIQHSDIEVQKKYLPMMKEAADAGEASWSSLALLIDRVNLREGGQQIYGSQVYRNDDGSYYVKDLENPEYVNKRRAEVGLGPIQDYVGRWGIEWDIEQKD